MNRGGQHGQPSMTRWSGVLPSFELKERMEEALDRDNLRSV